MKPDSEIEAEVAKELAARPGADAARITVQVHRGVVNLGGSVASYCEKYRLEEALRRIPDIAGIVNSIEVCPHCSVHLSDVEIRCAALHALQTEVPAAFDQVRVSVRNGELTLEGQLDCHFLRERAESAVRRVGTIPVIHNTITLKPEALAREVRERIEQRLRSTLQADAAGISIEPGDGAVTLRGHVASDALRELAEQAAWSVSGVTAVRNALVADGASNI